MINTGSFTGSFSNTTSYIGMSGWHTGQSPVTLSLSPTTASYGSGMTTASYHIANNGFGSWNTTVVLDDILEEYDQLTDLDISHLERWINECDALSRDIKDIQVAIRLNKVSRDMQVVYSTLIKKEDS